MLVLASEAYERRRLLGVLAALRFRALSSYAGAPNSGTVRRFHPQALLVDLDDGESGSLAQAQALRDDPEFEGVPLVVLMNHGDERECAAAFTAGADDFLLKPVEGIELAARLRNQVRRRDARVSVERQRESLRTMVEVWRAISATLDADEVLATIVRKVAEVTSAARSSIVLIDPAAGTGRVLATYERPDVKHLTIALEKYPEIRRAIATGEVVAIENMAADPITVEVRKEIERLGASSVLVVPIMGGEDVLGTILLHARRPGRPFTSEEVAFCRLVAHASLTAIRNANLYRALTDENKRLERLAITDAVTGTYNRAYLDARLDEEFDRAQRYRSPFAYVMLDVDCFKRVNDTFGHQVGDVVLRSLADAIKHASRKSDLVGRYGGEEFSILLPCTDLKGALRQAERLRKAVFQLRFEKLPRKERLTVSVGVAAFPDASVTCPHDLVLNADRALYTAKARGKNCVVGFPEQGTEAG